MGKVLAQYEPSTSKDRLSVIKLDDGSYNVAIENGRDKPVAIIIAGSDFSLFEAALVENNAFSE